MKLAVLCERGSDACLGLLGKARQLADSPGAGGAGPGKGWVIALAEAPCDPDAFAQAGADEVATFDVAEDDCAQGARIAEAIGLLQPEAALFPATVRGRFLSAWAAAQLETGLTADCTALAIAPEGLLLQSRPAFGGNLTADILCRERRPQMASVRPGVFPKPEPDFGKTAVLRPLRLRDALQRLRPCGFTPVENGVSLQTAQTVITGGKGVGGKAGFDVLFELAQLLHGAVGATRSAVDAGWIGYAHQVGQTGVTVRPKLYIAFGVSGLIQHTVGMNGSGTVIAVNSDRNAPIFSCADYGVVADWRPVAEEMIRNIRKERKEKP